jgi:DNA-directed RNA polymerase subunit RPC12/RpoP
VEQRTKAQAKVILAGVLILIAIVAVCVAKKKPASERLSSVRRFLICSDCGYIFLKNVGVKEKPPYTCERCGKKSAYVLLVCDQCGANVPMTHEKLEDNVCPYCGSHSLDFPRGDPRLDQQETPGQ